MSVVTVLCAACRKDVPFPILVHRDGIGCGPLVAICAPCDAAPRHLLWDRLAEPSTSPGAFKPVHLFTSFPDRPALRVS